MRRPALALLLGCLLLVAGASALDGYDYYQTIEYAGCDQEVYQQDIIIHRTTGTAYNETAGGLETWHIYVGEHCREDYGDIRFTNSTGAELAYYLWPDYDSSSARFCVRLEGADRDGVLAIHYGAPTATTSSLPTPLKVSYTSVGNHTYTVPDGITSVSVLVVAGGGCGGVCGNEAGGGGGGAGGVIAVEYDVSGQSSVPVVVGAGGVSASDGGTNGGDSQFGSLIAHGGGRGAGWFFPSYHRSSSPGGSGGGAGYGNVNAASPSIASSPEMGCGGGAGISSGNHPGGGGGGAGSVGGSASPGVAGAGGDGVQIWGSWYGGGGGGGIWTGTAGTGGIGGGGAGSASGRGGDASPNTGGGGGGSTASAGTATLGGSGAAGIVVVCIGAPWSATPPAALTFSGERETATPPMTPIPTPPMTPIPTRPRATEPIDNVSTSLVDDLIDSLGGETVPEPGEDTINWTGLISTIAGAYTSVLGPLAYTLIFSIPFLMMWITQRDMTLPGLVGALFGLFIIVRLPAEFHLVAVTFIAISIVAVVYSLVKERV